MASHFVKYSYHDSSVIVQLTSMGLKKVTFKVIGPAGIVTMVRVGVIVIAVAFVTFAAEDVGSP